MLSPVFFSTNNWREENIGAFYIRFFLIKIALEMRGKKIILGITGSIAAYKAAYLVRAFIKKGAEVQVVITPAGKEFITPVTLSALTGKPVVSEFFTANDGTWHSHVDLGLWADAMVIAPATASTIGKMANGIADNMLITTYLSAKAPVFIAPAMDLDMFAHPSTQHNLDLLRLYGNHIIEPGVGELASHLEGKGRMEEPDQIVAIIEKIYPVRFIGNYSSGKMGFALAEECAARGAEVTLIAGPVSLKAYHSSIRRIDVESAREMYDVALREYPGADAAIMCAAVADYAPDHCSDIKIKRSGDDIVLRLQPNPDIAAALGKIKRQNQVLAGFALETDNEEEHARLKMKRKNLDFIVLNSLKDAGAGFRCDTNKVTILTRDGEKIPFEVKPKKEVASDIISVLSGYMK